MKINNECLSYTNGTAELPGMTSGRQLAKEFFYINTDMNQGNTKHPKPENPSNNAPINKN